MKDVKFQLSITKPWTDNSSTFSNKNVDSTQKSAFQACNLIQSSDSNDEEFQPSTSIKASISKTFNDQNLHSSFKRELNVQNREEVKDSKVQERPKPS